MPVPAACEHGACMDDTVTREPLTPAGEAMRHGLWTPRSTVEFDDTLGDLFFEGPDLAGRLWRFGSLIVLSAAIAAFGLLADSAGVVIGAMLVAPLMTPIQALGAAISQGAPRRIAVSIVVILGGMVGAVATGYAVCVIGGETLNPDALPSEILARTAPGLLDLGIAVAAGAAGGYVIARPQVSSALPGVGIAVALVPPLATVGICLQLGERSLAGGALLLFLTNLAAIVLASAVMIFAAGFRSEHTATRHTRVGFVVAVLLVIGVGVPLTLHTLSVARDAQATRTVTRAIADWDPDVDIVSVEVDQTEHVVVVDLVVATTRDPLNISELADELRERLGKPVELDIHIQLEKRERAIAT